MAQTKIEAHTETAEFAATSAVLASPQHRPTLDRVTPLSVVAAYQSDTDADQLHPALVNWQENEAFDYLLAQRIMVPDDQDPEDALQRSIELAHDDEFRKAREDLFNWQNGLLNQGLQAEETINVLDDLINRYNECIKRKVKHSRIEIAILIGTLTTAGVATVAGIAPAYFGAMGIGALTGASVVQLGSFATGGMLQIAQQLNADEDQREIYRTAPAAMFHQIEDKLNTRWRPN